MIDAFGVSPVSRVAYGLASPACKFARLPYPGATKWKLFAPGTPKLLKGPSGLSNRSVVDV